VQIASYERSLVEGLNRSDVSLADKVFAADCMWLCERTSAPFANC
jgi:hypothetical protein